MYAVRNPALGRTWQLWRQRVHVLQHHCIKLKIILISLADTLLTPTAPARHRAPARHSYGARSARYLSARSARCLSACSALLRCPLGTAPARHVLVPARHVYLLVPARHCASTYKCPLGAPPPPRGSPGPDTYDSLTGKKLQGGGVLGGVKRMPIPSM